MNSNNSIVLVRDYLNNLEIVGKLNNDNSYENIYLLKNKSDNKLYVQKIVTNRKVSFFELHVHHVMRDNSHFIKMYDVLHVPECTFLTMEYIPDGDLYNIIHYSSFKFDEKKTRKLIFQLVNALNELHKQRIIHNDIKLENLLYERKKNKVYIGDYGLCVNIETPSSYDGTYEYFSPEKIKKELNQESFDWWAVGVVAYELLSCEYPYDLEVRKKISKKNTASIGSSDSYTDDDDDDFDPEELLKCQRKKLPKIKRVSPVANDFVQQMLCYDYTKRLHSYNSIMRHPFLKF
ncbi:PK-1 [Mocis latipes granulovirus]|uniref:PK-1 n=1 Tax=Mocis latipes granulovirus TaxID=2072024 RepID=A0A162GV70_9BBAC|nr:PK-1 [Mocis latipes granulovirus]AKR17399.1 PK-1 [Mocis latipes granulovirus]